MVNMRYYVLITAILAQVCAFDECVDPSIEEKVFYSDVFAYGEVKELHQEKSKVSRVPDTHMVAEIELFCIFKGETLPQDINMTIPDYDSDPCVSYKFTKGETYLLYLDTTDGVIRPSFNEDPASMHIEIDLVSLLCDVTIKYPIGVDADNASEKCPKPQDDYGHDDGCVRFDPDSDYNEYYTDWSDYMISTETESSTLRTVAMVTMETPVKSSAHVNIVTSYITLTFFMCLLLL